MQIEILVWFELQFTKIFSPIRLSICISLTISSLSFSQRDVTDQKKWVETFRTQAWFRFRVVQAHLFCSKAANLRPALGHGCGKQTPSVSILFFRKKLLHVPNVEFYRRVRSRSVRNVQDRNIKDLGLCMTSGKIPKSCTDLDPTILYSSILGTCSKFVRAGLGFVQTNVQIQWNPAYKAFHRVRFVETNQLFGSNPNVILTRQTCGHRSSRVAGSKRRALAFHYTVRIWYMFLI